MARPSNKDQRSEEILVAYERCIAKFGVEGSTLEKIAKEAGISRALLRHHVGNQDVLLQQAIKRFITRTEQQCADLTPQRFASIDDFLDTLFIYDQKDYINDTLIAHAIITASLNNADIRAQFSDWFSTIRSWIYQHLAHKYPQASQQQLLTVSSGVLSIWSTFDITLSISNQEFRDHAANAVSLLLNSLAA